MFIAWKKFKYRFRATKKKRNYKKEKMIRKLLLFIICILVFFSIILGFYIFEERISGLAQEAAISELNSEITKNVNTIIEEIVNEEKIDFMKLIYIDNNYEETLSMTTDYNTVNKIKSVLAIKIQEEMDKLSVIKTKIPVGMLFSNTIMTGAGINIPVKIFVANEIDIQFYSDFSDAGINQTRCRLWIEIRIPTKVAGLTSYQEDEIITQIPLAEKIILGNVPQVYMDRQ